MLSITFMLPARSFNSFAVIYQVKVTSGMSPGFNLYGCALIGIHLSTHLFFFLHPRAPSLWHHESTFERTQSIFFPP
jgi:hypothetical protein